MYTLINIGTNQVMGLRELLSAYSLRFVDWLEKIVQPDPKDRYPDAESAFNAFKPLYVNRVPEAIVSSSVLEFTASKLGERITQTLTVRNNVPETVLEGWWEVALHPSDPPHTPDSHAWISFRERKFSGNANEWSIVINTKNLMAGKTYKRHILLHSNSLKEIEEVTLIVKTARIQIQVDKLLYRDLLFLASVIASITSCLKIYFSAFVAILSVIPGLTCYLLAITVLGSLSLMAFISSDEEQGQGCGCIGIIMILGIVGSFTSSNIFYVLNNNSAAILVLILTFILFYIVFWMLFDINNKYKSKANDFSIERAILMTFFLGISIPLTCLMGSQNSWFPIIVFSTSFALIVTPTYSIIRHKRLVSKYRDSEEGLIKP